MTRSRPERDCQRGNSLLLALIVMSSLATLGSLTVVSVQSSLKASTNDRSQTVAMYAAESGGAAAMDLLRRTFSPSSHWNAYVTLPTNPVVPLTSPALPSSGAVPGSPDNLFTADQNAWYSVEIRNNRNDPGYFGGTDDDQQVIVRSTGHGPQGSVAILEWEVHWPLPNPVTNPPLTPPQPLVLLGWHVVL
jgi:hypothetical protein